MVPDFAHVGFTAEIPLSNEGAEIPLSNEGFPARFLAWLLRSNMGGGFHATGRGSISRSVRCRLTWRSVPHLCNCDNGRLP